MVILIIVLNNLFVRCMLETTSIQDGQAKRM
nr:MAG TPA: hypothetical protein [Bacteriophage sp.]DAO62318.1 MAG TPA: hypothetical protein [Caudoviricetes sp.]DAT80346.1 MAG TPA: hypothetical protein [Bacteriophage sp.]DAX02538.1 MAG TPA: hypothetical protein [Bacteriophage sp.]DAZ02512.1 MAG TPA: hypothetical protein [Caudoviricetes sp.]